MNKFLHLIIIFFMWMALLPAQEAKVRVGVVLDKKTRVGKEAKVGIEMAIDDFNSKTNQSLVLQLQVRNSQSKPWLAALAGINIIILLLCSF